MRDTPAPLCLSVASANGGLAIATVEMRKNPELDIGTWIAHTEVGARPAARNT